MEMLKTTIEKLLEAIRNQRKQWNEEQKALQTRYQQAYMEQFMYAMASDLFEALKSHTYPKTHSIYSPPDIRIRGYKNTPQGLVFQFSIFNNVEGNTPRIVLKQIADTMNKDIAYCQQALLRLYSYENVYLLHPFICNGIYIISIEENGCEFVLNVVTHCRP